MDAAGRIAAGRAAEDHQYLVAGAALVALGEQEQEAKEQHAGGHGDTDNGCHEAARVGGQQGGQAFKHER